MDPGALRRRALLPLPAAVLVPALLAHRMAAAQSERPPGRMGYLHPRTVAPDHVAMVALRPEWKRLGYFDSDSLLLRAAEGQLDRLGPLAAELEQSGVKALIAVGAEAVTAARKATRQVAIVGVDLETDPVRAGYAASYSRPGGRITGLFLDQPSIAGKAIDLLLEASPRLQRVAILWQPTTGRHLVDTASEALRARRIDSQVLPYGPGTDYDQLLQPLANERRSGVVVLSSAGFSLDAARCAAVALRLSLPTISFLKAYARAGLLMSYGPNQELYFARAAAIADRVVRGTPPGDIPIEKPTRFEFVINSKTASALRLNTPQSLLVQADDVL